MFKRLQSLFLGVFRLKMLWLILIIFILGFITVIYSETTVIESGNVGWEPSIAIDTNEIRHISHYDSTNADLRYCNDNNGWSCEIIDSIGDIGKWSSIAVDSNNELHISYQNFTGGDLKYCNGTSGSWSCETIDNGGANDVGKFSSLAVDSNDEIHIAYHDDTDGDLEYCNGTSGSWSCATIYSTGDFGWDNSIAIDSNDKAHIATTDDDPNWKLYYCNNTDGTWGCLNTGFSSGAQGQSIAIDSNDTVHISVFAGGNCNTETDCELRYLNNSGGSWSQITLDTSMGSSATGIWPSIAIDMNDKIHIVYGNQTGNSLMYCNNTQGGWGCNKIGDIDDSDLGYPHRGIAIKKGVIATSTSFSENMSIVYHNDTPSPGALIYITQQIFDFVDILTPTDDLFGTMSIDLNVTNEGKYNNTIWYSWNNGVINNTLCSDCNSPNWTTITFPRQGYFNLTVWANDSNGNIASDETTNLFVGNITNLNTAGNENMDDTYVYQAAPTTNYGTDTDIKVVYHSSGTDNQTILIRFNISIIPANSIINNATISLNNYYVGASANVGVHDLYSTYGWTETNVTWNTRPTNTQYNITPHSSVFIDTANVYNLWNVTGLVQKAVTNNHQNVSFYFVSSTVAGDNIIFTSKESATVGKRPSLNITYYTSNTLPNITILYPNNNTKFNTTSDYNISINITDDNDYVLNATLYINGTLNSTITYPSLNAETFFLFNASSGTYNAWVLVYDSNEATNTSENWTIRINSPPTLISTELNKTSGVLDIDDLNCSAVGEADIDSEDVLTLHYEWYNNSIAINYDAVALFNDNTTATETWYCEAWVADNYLNSSKYTSTSVIIGSSSTAPSIDSINATTAETLINSTSSFPTNNNSWINFSVSFTDADDNNWTAYLCTTPTFSTCVANASSEILCLSEANSTSKALSCDYNVSGVTRGEKTFYGFVLDNESLTSSATSSTYEINFPPSQPTLTSPAVNTFIGINYTLLDWISTDDDSDTINYTVYVNSSAYEYTFYWNGSDSEYNFTNATTEYETYNWRIFAKDIHDYGVHNITLGNFTTDFTKPNLTVSSPTQDITYNAETVSLTLSANDFAIDVCNYTLYYKDTGTVKTNGEVSCTGSASLSTPYYTGGYQVIAYAYDKAGNSNSTEINFTTLTAETQSTGGGGGVTTLAPEKEVEQPKLEAEKCGNNICEAGEDPLSCQADCRMFSLDEMFCMPLFNCGNWKRSWFINIVVISVLIGMVYMTYKGKITKKRRPI